SNVRDRLMAENLLFLLEKYPTKKIVCWGASPHFADRIDLLTNEELRDYKPMGKILKEKLGEKIFNIGFITSSGTYGSITDSIKPVPKPTSNSLEAMLANQNIDFAFIETKNNKIFDTISIAAIEYTPLKGKWSQVFDGLLYVKSFTPSFLATSPFTASNDTSQTKKSDTSKNSILAIEKSKSNKQERKYQRSKASKSNVAISISGYLKDIESQKPITYANVRVKNFGTLTNEKGFFEFLAPISANDSLLISCIGYQSLLLPLQRLNNQNKQYLLSPSTTQLETIIIKGESLTPEKILKRAIDKIPLNYLNEPFNTEYYTQAWGAINNDTLFDVEYVSKTALPAYHYKKDIDFFKQQSKILGIKWQKKIEKDTFLFFGDHLIRLPISTCITNLPFLRKSNIKKYDLEFINADQSLLDSVYVIRFKAKHPSYRTTGEAWVKNFSGVLYISTKDYALLRIDTQFINDMRKHNKIGQKFDPFDKGYTFYGLIDESVSQQTLVFTKDISNYYYLSFSSHSRYNRGVDRRNYKPYTLKEVSKCFLQRIETKNIESITSNDIFLRSIPYNSHFWENYQIDLNIFK
ncbi:MAG: erythromycin esterase family protein, partial [Verrucomicrobia bacterium]|nr:erythromycin esterase family protein [Cytophagales bacterium]